MTERESWTVYLLPVALIAGLAILLGLNMGPAEAAPEMGGALEAWLERIALYVSAGAEMAAALVIGIGVVRALFAFLFKAKLDAGASGPIRVDLGRALLLGLEFTIASDILRTAVAPTRQEIATLAAIVLLRTLLNFFLEREIRQKESA